MKREMQKETEEKFIMNNNLSDIEFDLIAKYIMIRMNEGISQRKLAELTNMAQSTIARIENNVRSANLTTFIKMLDSLGYHLEIVKNEK